MRAPGVLVAIGCSEGGGDGRAAARARPLPPSRPQLSPKREVRRPRKGWGRGGGGAAVKSSHLIGSLGTYYSYAGKKPQLPACAVSKTGLGFVRGGCGRSTARAQARGCVCVPPPAAIPVHPERWGREPSPEVR